MPADSSQDAQTTVYIAEQLAAGVSSQNIISALTLAGWTRPEAESAVAAVVISTGQIPVHSPDETHHRRRSRTPHRSPAQPVSRAAALRQVIHGSICCAAGIVVTVLTFLHAAHNGGMFVVTWGLIAYGATRLLTGIYHLRNASSN